MGVSFSFSRGPWRMQVCHNFSFLRRRLVNCDICFLGCSVVWSAQERMDQSGSREGEGRNVYNYCTYWCHCNAIKFNYIYVWIKVNCSFSILVNKRGVHFPLRFFGITTFFFIVWPWRFTLLQCRTISISLIIRHVNTCALLWMAYRCIHASSSLIRVRQTLE